MPRIKFVDYWDEATKIGWWNKGRKRLNKVIRKFNKWQTDKAFDYTYGCKVLRHIEAEKQGIGARDGGSDYFKLLDEMERFVKDNLESHCPHCGSVTY